MTSPFTKPNATQDKYQDVYSRGGTYGSDLRNEQDVRNLLKTEIKSPFVRAMKQVGDAIEGFVGDIASAIRGDGGAKYQAINVAVTERLGPINTAITETGARHKELADKVDEKVKEQDSTLSSTRQALSELDTAVKQLKDFDKEQKAKVQSSIDTAKSATAQAAELRGELTKLANGLDTRIEQSKAAKDLQSKFDKLNNEFGSRVDSAISGSAKVRELTEQSKTTLDALMNPIDVGTSLVTVNPVTKVPYWAESATESTNIAPPVEGAKVYSNKDTEGTVGLTSTGGGMVTVDPRLEYEASFWLRVGTKGVRTVIELRDQDSKHAVLKSTSFDDSKAKYSGTNYVWWSPANLEPGWHFIHQKFTLKGNVSQAKLSNIYWHHSGGAYGTASICNLNISPVIPTQASVDAAQNKAIEALEKATATHTLSLANQKQINEESAKWRVETEDWKAKKDQFEKTTKDFLKTQAAVEQLQTKTDTAQNDALTALNKPEMADSLVPMVPNNGRISGVGKYDWIPEYATFSSSATAFADGVYIQSNSRENTLIQGTPVDVEPGGVYKVEFTAAAATDGSSIFLELRDDATNELAVQTSTTFRIVGDTSKTEYGRPWRYLIGDVQLKKGTHTYVGYVTLNDNVRKAKLWTLYWNHPNGTATGVQRLESLKAYRHVPSQAEIDEMQNKALEQSEKFDLAQVQINRLVQEQLWNHQDTMEMLDIRSPKTYGYEVGANIWTIKKNPYISAGQFNFNYRVNTSISPFVTMLVPTGDKPQSCFVVCRGKWVGGFEIRINWTNGAVDVWNKKVPTGNARVFTFSGGNPTISIRNISVTVVPACLNREMSIELSRYDSVGDSGTMTGDKSLLRGVYGGTSFRLSAPARCNRALDILNEDGEWEYLRPYTAFSGKVVRLRSANSSHTFTEVWDYNSGWDKPEGNDYDSHSPKTPMEHSSVG